MNSPRLQYRIEAESHLHNCLNKMENLKKKKEKRHFQIPKGCDKKNRISVAWDTNSISQIKRDSNGLHWQRNGMNDITVFYPKFFFSQF